MRTRKSPGHGGCDLGNYPNAGGLKPPGRAYRRGEAGTNAMPASERLLSVFPARAPVISAPGLFPAAPGPKHEGA